MTTSELMGAFPEENRLPGCLGGAAAYVQQLRDILGHLPVDVIDAIVSRLISAYDSNQSVFLMGNGGSAALASHIACDLGKGTAANGIRRFRVLSLTDNVPLITAWANDNSYEDIFAEQIKNFLVPGDICLAISGSGNSPNVLKALKASRALGGYNVGLTGFEGGNMRALCDLCLVVPSDSMQHIEDAHVAISHAVFMAVRSHLATPMRLRATTGKT